MNVVHTRDHIKVGFANPNLICDQCGEKVPYWHNPERCGCDNVKWFNYPCGHTAGVTSKCPSWGPVDGCICEGEVRHDK